MSGIKYLLDIYEKKGKSFIEKLFNKNVTVTENLDGSSFSFEKDFTGDDISFYKKDQDNPITRVDRILMKYYEKPIIYIDSLPVDIKSQIPKGWRFGMAYFPSTKPVRMEYDRIPRNYLILTHVTVRDEFGDVVRTIQDKEELDIWAEKLGVEGPPIIFQGRLSRDQKIGIMEFLSTPMIDLKGRFKTESFTKYLISLLNPDMDKTFLGKDLKGDVESIIFRFEQEDEEDETILAKMVDPIFYEISRERKVKRTSHFPSDIYSLCLIDVMNFILEYGVENFEAEGEGPETRYIGFIFSVFKKFIESEGDRYIGVDFEKPEYLKSEGFEINKEIIEDPEVVSVLDEDEVYVEILQMILNSFRKYKRKPHGFFSEGLVQQFNMLVDEIASYVNAKKKSDIDESLGLLSFTKFKKDNYTFVPLLNEDEYSGSEDSDNVEEDYDDYHDNILFESKENEESNEEKMEDTSEFFTFKDFKKVISTNKEKKKIKILKEDKERVNIIIGKFQPFNNGHLKMCTRLKKENNLPVFLCVVHPGGDTNKKYPFSEDIIKKSIGALTSENPELFSGYSIIPSDLLEDSIKNISDKVNPVSVCIGEEDFQNMVLQREWIKDKYELPSGNIEIFKTPRWANNSEIRSYIKEGDFQNFKNKVPKSIAVLFNEFTKGLKG